MLLSKKIVFKPNKEELVILRSLSYCSAKLWNIGNYEKHNYKNLGFSKYPNWYDQKKRLKDEYFYKCLPSQTAQDVLDRLEKSWKSFFELNKTKGIQNPKPPRFKKDSYNFTFLNNGYKVLDENTIRFSVPKTQKDYLNSNHSININYLTLKIENFSKVDGFIKTIEFKPLKNNLYQINIVYETNEAKTLTDNGHYLSIDIGISNLFTCYDNAGESFIVSGGRYLEVSKYFHKKIAHFQSIANSQQGKDFTSTKKISGLYEKKNKQLNHYFHSVTKYVRDYCIKNNISRVVIGDIKGIRKNCNIGRVNNQKFHSLPYNKIYNLLEYKLKREGIVLIKQKEHYTSQVSPFAKEVSKNTATKNKRKCRGLYIDNMTLFNADSVGAFNILRLYNQTKKIGLKTPVKGLSNPVRINVSV